jgi:hypothetical protein
MTISKVADIPEQDVVAVDGGYRSMLQQNIWDSHGHEMHPQQFVRLVGCPQAAHHEARPA